MENNTAPPSKCTIKTISTPPLPVADQSHLPLRIGILGAANIARKNVKAIQHLTNINHCKLVAIASRSEAKAIEFLHNHVATEGEQRNQQQKGSAKQGYEYSNWPQLYTGKESYNKLIQADDVDALYIPLPTSLHLEYVKRALGEGKHVLVEKPVGTSSGEYEEMIGIAQKMNKYLMDGTMFVHNPRTNDVCSCISPPSASSSDGAISNTDSNIDVHTAAIGEILRIDSTFTFLGDDDFFANNIRISSSGDPLGCIGDLGWYNIRMAQLAFRSSCSATTAKSAQVVHYELNENGVPIDTTCLVAFDTLSDDDAEGNDDNKVGPAMTPCKKRTKILSFHCSFLHPLTQTVSIHGSKKSIIMDDFVIPRDEENGNKKLTFDVKSQSLTFADLCSLHSNQTKESSSDGKCPQEVLMWKNFAKFCRAYDGLSNNTNDDDQKIREEGKTLSNVSFENQKIVDALMESIRQDGKKISIS